MFDLELQADSILLTQKKLDRYGNVYFYYNLKIHLSFIVTY